MTVPGFVVGDVGTTFLFDANTDISGASAYKLEFCKPNGLVLTVTAVLGTVDDPDDPTALADQYVTYVWQTGDLDVSGIWNAVLHLEGTPDFRSDKPPTFRVRPKP